MTMVAAVVGKWVATVSSRDLLISDFLWGFNESGPLYIMSCWTKYNYPRYRATLWLTGSEFVGLTSARHSRQVDDKKVCRHPNLFTWRAEVDYNDDDNVTNNVIRELDDQLLRAGMKAE